MLWQSGGRWKDVGGTCSETRLQSEVGEMPLCKCYTMLSGAENGDLWSFTKHQRQYFQKNIPNTIIPQPAPQHTRLTFSRISIHIRLKNLLKFNLMTCLLQIFQLDFLASLPRFLGTYLPHSSWHIVWHFFWHFFRHSFWHLCRRSFWHVLLEYFLRCPFTFFLINHLGFFLAYFSDLSSPIFGIFYDVSFFPIPLHSSSHICWHFVQKIS